MVVSSLQINFCYISLIIFTPLSHHPANCLKASSKVNTTMERIDDKLSFNSLAPSRKHCGGSITTGAGREKDRWCCHHFNNCVASQKCATKLLSLAAACGRAVQPKPCIRCAVGQNRRLSSHPFVPAVRGTDRHAHATRYPLLSLHFRICEADNIT